jgi:HicB family
MDLTLYVRNLRHELAVVAELGGEDARVLFERLTAPLESAIRMTLLDALSAAADEITREFAPVSVELRLRAGEPEFVVAPPPADELLEPQTVASPPEGDEGATARINLRLPEQLKAGIEEAAARERLSVNAWLVRAVAAALMHGDPDRPPRRRGGRLGESYTGWVR